MQEKGLLSVIIPVYKVEPYLRRCLDSVCGQTYKKLQIILVDDGSPDQCGAICDEYAAKDPRIEVIHQKNEGRSGARNNGLAHAKGEFVAFVDSDDWLHPLMYQILTGLMGKYHLDMARCAAVESDGKKEKKILPRKGTPVHQVLTGEKISSLYFSEFLCKAVWNAVYRRKTVDSIQSPQPSARMMVIDKCLYYHFTEGKKQNQRTGAAFFSRFKNLFYRVTGNLDKGLGKRDRRSAIGRSSFFMV